MKTRYHINRFDRPAIFSVILVMILAFSAGMIITLMWLTPNVKECLEEPFFALKPIIRKWNEKHEVGTVITYYCSSDANAPLYKITRCNSSLLWDELYSNECTCRNDPVHPVSQEVYDWDGQTRSLEHTVNYRCDGFEHSVMAMRLTCTNNRRWEEIEDEKYQNICTCDLDYPKMRATEEHASIYVSSPTIGSLAVLKCSSDIDAPIRSIYLCTQTGNWQKIMHNDCSKYQHQTCPQPYPEDLLSVMDTLQNKNFVIGFRHLMRCTKNKYSYIYRTIECDKYQKWHIEETNEGNKEPCASRYHIMSRKIVYDLALSWCHTQGGTLVTISTIEEMELVMKLMSYYKSCSKYFVGFKEDLNRQWVKSTGGYLTQREAKRWWEEDYPKGSGQCVVIDKQTHKWINTNCSDNYCIVCETKADSKESLNCFLGLNGETRCYTYFEEGTYKMGNSKCLQKISHPIANFDSTTREVLPKFLNLTLSPCTKFYVGLRLIERRYISVVNEILNLPLLSESDEMDLTKICLKMKSEDSYTLLHQANCDEELCNICEFQGEDRGKLIDAVNIINEDFIISNRM